MRLAVSSLPLRGVTVKLERGGHFFSIQLCQSDVRETAIKHAVCHAQGSGGAVLCHGPLHLRKGGPGRGRVSVTPGQTVRE